MTQFSIAKKASSSATPRSFDEISYNEYYLARDVLGKDTGARLVRKVTLEVGLRHWRLREPFVISRQTITDAVTLHVRLAAPDGHQGQGEAVGLDYAGETPESMMADVEQVRGWIEQGASRRDLLTLMPAGGARLALDSALWDLEAKRDGVDPFARCGLAKAPVRSALTIGIRPAAEVEQLARRLGPQALKVKVGAADPIAVVEAARRGAPEANLIVDPNQAWSVDMLRQLAPRLAELRVDLLEQPIPVGAEADLDGVASPVPLCADEAVDGIEDLSRIEGRFQAINIKLDKAGGLTAAMDLADAAEARGLKLMVGCMVGPSLPIAPAMVLAQRCAFVDLDAPIFLERDVEHGFSFDQGLVRQVYKPALWG